MGRKDLNGRRWVPYPQMRYGVEMTFTRPDSRYLNHAEVSQIEDGDVLLFMLEQIDDPDYVPVSHIYDYSDTPIWNSTWSIWKMEGGQRRKLGNAAYRKLAKLFSDEASIKHNWQESFGAYKRSCLDDRENPAWKRASEHLFPNFMLRQLDR